MTAGTEPAFRVLMVCTANHCRSPIAQQLLAHDAAARFGPGGWQIDSAGTAIPGPWPLHELAATVITERVGAVADHASRQLSGSQILDADLILTATRQHRSAVVGILPAALGRTFTILQFARLCSAVTEVAGNDPRTAGLDLVNRAKLARSSLQPVPGDWDDLPDPMGRGLAEFERCADSVQTAIDAILRPLRAE